MPMLSIRCDAMRQPRETGASYTEAAAPKRVSSTGRYRAVMRLREYRLRCSHRWNAVTVMTGGRAFGGVR
jgi:hypothetical protein